MQTINNAGIITQTQSDLDGRTVSTIQNYTTGSPHTSTLAQDVTTAEIYDADGRLSAEVAFDASGSWVAPQETMYLYQSLVDGSLQTATINADSTTPPLTSQSVSSLGQSGGTATATVASGSGYNYPAGQSVLISGATPTAYNGWFQVTGNTANSFSYSVPSGTATSATGSVSVESLLTAYQGISSLSWSGGIATAAVANSNLYAPGQWVYVSGANVSGYNGWFQITQVTVNPSPSFSFGLPTNPGGNATTGQAQALAPVQGGGPAGSDTVQTTYDLQGRTLTSTDQRGVEHSCTYDSSGDVIIDNVTSFGNLSQAAETVNQIDTSYNDLGQVYQVTSCGMVNNTETTINQDQYQYDGWGDLIQEWQSQTVGQAVNTSSTPSVQYTYADGSGSSGVAQFVRPTVLTYPNGRQIDYNYAAGVDSIMSRISNITDYGAPTPDVAYSYLGADTPVTVNYQQPQVELDYSANDFQELDRFGRVVDQVWASYGSASGDLGTIDGYNYGYNNTGDRTSAANLTNNALSETFGYDSLDRLTSMNRGVLSGGTIANPGDTQTWTLDSLGNFSNYDNNGSNQARTVDAANEIQSIKRQRQRPAYDLAGNMTTTPSPTSPSTGLTCDYDAWNRLVQVSNGSTILAEYQLRRQLAAGSWSSRISPARRRPR